MKPLFEQDNIDELVFSKRNKLYGAYKLRKQYHRHMSLGMCFTIFCIVTSILFSKCDFREEEIVSMELPSEVVYEVSTEMPPLDIPASKPATTTVEEVMEPEVNDETFKVVKNEMPEVKEEPKDEPKQESKPEPEIAPTPSNGNGNGVVESVNNNASSGVQGDIIMKPDIMPKFPGGDMALSMFIQQNINYPFAARTALLEGRVIVRFVINTDGSISNIEIYRGIGSGCDEEATRVVQKMPRWIPGSVKGNPVRVRYNLPINFKLDKKRSS